MHKIFTGIMLALLVAPTATFALEIRPVRGITPPNTEIRPIRPINTDIGTVRPVRPIR